MRRFIYEHSFSIVCAICFIITNGLFFFAESGHWYDFLNMLAGCFGGGLIMAILGRCFWEKGSDPTKPPE